jgi:hypothetical protein
VATIRTTIIANIIITIIRTGEGTGATTVIGTTTMMMIKLKRFLRPRRMEDLPITRQVFLFSIGLACIAHKSLKICKRCRLWQRNSPATPENSAAFWGEEFKNSLFGFIYFKTGS